MSGPFWVVVRHNYEPLTYLKRGLGDPEWTDDLAQAETTLARTVAAGFATWIRARHNIEARPQIITPDSTQIQETAKDA